MKPRSYWGGRPSGHLSPSQRAAVATEFEEAESKLAAERMRNGAVYRDNIPNDDPVVNLPQGERGRSRNKAAEMFGVSGKSVSDAKYVKNHDPATFEKVKAGDVAVSRAGMPVKRPRMAVDGLTVAGWGTGPGGVFGGISGRSVRDAHYP